MKKYVLFDVAEGTQNLGDYIIMDCIMEEMKEIFSGNFLTHYSTHTPIARCYQNFRRNMMSSACNNADKKFICGASTIKNTLFRISPDWNINIFNIKYYRDSITIGVGMDMNSKNMDIYTKYIYKKIFSKSYIHSVRDERTKQEFIKLGYKAINTGCPTIWALDKKHCMQIPREKRNNVVFTLTDYKQDKVHDQKLIDILKKNYNNVYYWVQGSEDYEYFNQFDNINDIEIINPDLSSYKEILNNEDIEYVGTRLHAGIFAMRNRRRAIILSIDNRAEDMSATYNLNTLKREKISDLEKMINSSLTTNIIINEKAINEWKDQFRLERK